MCWQVLAIFLLIDADGKVKAGGPGSQEVVLRVLVGGGDGDRHVLLLNGPPAGECPEAGEDRLCTEVSAKVDQYMSGAVRAQAGDDVEHVP